MGRVEEELTAENAEGHREREIDQVIVFISVSLCVLCG
jgi:hypothetical protein